MFVKNFLDRNAKNRMREMEREGDRIYQRIRNARDVSEHSKMTIMNGECEMQYKRDYYEESFADHSMWIGRVRAFG